ncbi:hypothetical protein F183_A52110 [Bryobacterales bacterium F-183]|nr:hypothetical protein F183_A52110 [Bryobacterales bacterium F-183]
MLLRTTLLLIAAVGAAQASCLKLDGQDVCTPSYTRLENGLDSFSSPSSSNINAEQFKEKQRWLTPYRASQLALLGGMAADISSSWGCAEANPLLRSADGRFYAKGTVIKVGLTSAGLLMTHMFKRKFPKLEKPLAFMMGSTSGFLYYTAFRNHSMPCY